MLTALKEEGVSFLIVGAYALAVHGTPRATGDLDIWIRPEPENAGRAWRALIRFGAPVAAMNLTAQDLSLAGMVYQIGVAPRRIDILTEISGVEFGEAWESRRIESFDGIEVAFLGREALLKNKRASGRPKDLADVENLEGHPPSS
jgi:hypothetical protein